MPAASSVQIPPPSRHSPRDAPSDGSPARDFRTLPVRLARREERLRMTWYKLSSRSTRLGACALSACFLALGACDANELLEPRTEAPLAAADTATDVVAGL